MDPDDPAPGDHELVEDAHATAQRVTGVVAGGTFVGLHAVVGGLILTFAGLVRPAILTGLLVVWVATAVVGWRGRRRRPLVTMLVPFAVAGAAIVAVSLWGTSPG